MQDDVQPGVWSAELEELLVRVGHRFGRVDLRRRMRAYVHGLLAPVGRKNSWRALGQGPKTVDPRSGTTVRAGDKLTYNLSFKNTGQGVASVDYTDHMADVLDDATLIGDIKASDGLTATGPDGKKLHITGAVQPGKAGTVTYTVKVNAYNQQGDHHLGNFLTLTGEEPPGKCAAQNPLCTQNPTDPPKPADPHHPSEPGLLGSLPRTGTTTPLVTALAALLALGLGGGLLLASRRRKTATASEGTAPDTGNGDLS